MIVASVKMIFKSSRLSIVMEEVTFSKLQKIGLSPRSIAYSNKHQISQPQTSSYTHHFRTSTNSYGQYLTRCSRFKNQANGKTFKASAFRKKSITNSLNQQQRSQQQHIYHQQQSRTTRDILNAARTKMHSILLRVHTLPIPRWISPRQYSFTLSELCGHGSFILVAIAYAVDDFLLLRMIAVAGSTSMLVFTYFHPHGRIQWLPFKWNALFIALNLYRIGKAYYETYAAELLSNEMLTLHATHLPLVELKDFAKLVQIGTEETFHPDEVIIKQGEVVPYMRVVISGTIGVYRDDIRTYSVEEGNFLSESGLHAGLDVIDGVESCATGKALTKVRCLRWDRTKLMELCHSDKTLYRALQFAVCWDIVRKLKKQRNYLIQNVENPELWTRKRKEQTDSRYASILENILHHHGHLYGHQEQLKNYRVMHQIDDEQHLKALQHCGWTLEEFNLASRRNPEKAIQEEQGLKDWVLKLLHVTY